MSNYPLPLSSHNYFPQYPIECNYLTLRYEVTFNFVNFFFLGKMKGIAFVQDPDGYWIEILNGEKLVKITEEFASQTKLSCNTLMGNCGVILL